MLKTTLAALLVTTGLAAAPAFAQGAAAPVQFVTDQGTTEFRASKFIGLDVYGRDDEKIGDIKEILIAPDGQAKGAVLGVGGFLGIGEKSVAVAWSALAWSNDKPAAKAASASPAPASTGSTNDAGSTANAPASTGATTSAGSPAATVPATPSRSPAEQAAYNGYPDHATVMLTKADLQNAPAFRYYSETHASTGAASNATPPAARP